MFNYIYLYLNCFSLFTPHSLKGKHCVSLLIQCFSHRSDCEFFSCGSTSSSSKRFTIALFAFATAYFNSLLKLAYVGEHVGVCGLLPCLLLLIRCTHSRKVLLYIPGSSHCQVRIDSLYFYFGVETLLRSMMNHKSFRYLRMLVSFVFVFTTILHT